MRAKVRAIVVREYKPQDLIARLLTNPLILKCILNGINIKKSVFLKQSLEAPAAHSPF